MSTVNSSNPQQEDTMTYCYKSFISNKSSFWIFTTISFLLGSFGFTFNAVYNRGYITRVVIWNDLTSSTGRVFNKIKVLSQITELGLTWLQYWRDSNNAHWVTTL